MNNGFLDFDGLFRFLVLVDVVLASLDNEAAVAGNGVDAMSSGQNPFLTDDATAAEVIVLDARWSAPLERDLVGKLAKFGIVTTHYTAFEQGNPVTDVGN